MSFKFIDRESDVDSAQKFLSRKGDFQSIVYKARPASGFSTFLEYICRNPRHRDVRIFASKNEGDIYISLIRSIQQSQQGRDQLRKAVLSTGVQNGFEILCTMIPYIGPGITAYQQKIEKAGLENRNLPREIVLSFLKSYASSNNLILAIDNIQSATEDMKELIYLVKEYELNRVRLLLGHVARKDSEETAGQFSDRVYNLGLKIIDKEFINPNEEFIVKYIKAISPNLELSAAEISEECNGDIYRIKRMVSSKSAEINTVLTGLEKFSLVLLDSVSQPLRVSDLTTILLDTDQVYVNCESEISDAIERLLRINYIKKDNVSHGDTFLSLRANSEAKRALSLADRLVIADIAYSYFRKFYRNSTRHSKAELSGLLYRLSQMVSPESVSYWSRELINSSLGAGTLDIARAQISNSLSIGSPKSKADLITDVTFNFLNKQYNHALELLSNKDYHKWLDDNYLSVLKAVCLNRCRKHLASEKHIKNLLKHGVNNNDACILYSFSINGLVHDNNLIQAKRVFEENLIKFKNVRSYPTFLRTASSIYPPKLAIPYLKEAKDISLKYGDVFGVAAISANIGVSMMEIGQHKAALTLLNEAYDDLLVFGPHHLHIVQNNLGICNIVLGNFRKAEILLKKSSRVNSIMPNLYSRINHAICISISGNPEHGLALMTDMKDEVNECMVDRVRQRYYINFALISWRCNEDNYEFNEKLKMAWKNKDRKYPEKTINTLSLISQKPSMTISNEKRENIFKEHWQPCYLEYWYFNPLSSLTDSYIVD